MKTLADPIVYESVLARMASLRPDSTRHWGRMSAHQMICHLADSFRGPMGERTISPATGVVLRPVIKWIALYAPFHWPKGVPTRPEVEQGAGGTPPTDFERDRKDLLAALRRFSDKQRAFQWHPHPMFGEMRDAEWLRWGFLHTDHHLRQFGV